MFSPVQATQSQLVISGEDCGKMKGFEGLGGGGVDVDKGLVSQHKN